MNYAIWLFIFYIFILEPAKQNKTFIIQRIISKKKGKVKVEMNELIKNFIGKNCFIRMINSQLVGKITEVRDGAIVVEHGKNVEIVNLDYIISISEYGKKKKK